MCTAAVYKTKDLYFGRTLDNEMSYGDEITITPRNYSFYFQNAGVMHHHYAFIGMAHVVKNYPLYYDAINEKGLGIAGLNFVGNAHYNEVVKDKYNIAPYELIPWILNQCATVKETKEVLEKISLVNLPFSEELPLSQLHWIIADSNETITLESTQNGLHVYDNPVGILTNNPPFENQMFQLNNYMNLSSGQPKNNFCTSLPLQTYSLGMGALGLPGDLSSQSRFIRASFVKSNSISGDSEMESVSQFFHILGSVTQQKGCCCLGNDKYQMTFYTSCCNAQKGIYYYTTYNNHQITAVDMYKEQLDTTQLIRYTPITEEQIKMQN